MISVAECVGSVFCRAEKKGKKISVEFVLTHMAHVSSILEVFDRSALTDAYEVRLALKRRD